MLVENNSDELRVGVKGQSSSVIARSPRNSFRASLGTFRDGGRATRWTRGPSKVTESNETPNAVHCYPGSQTVGAKLHCREENSPDHLLRSQNFS